MQTSNARRQQQRTWFPLSENLSALIFVSLADLTQDQRNTLTSIMTHRGRTLAEYTVQELRDLFLEMFCTTRTAVDNPMMQPSGMAQRRSFLVMEEGEIDGTTGYWAEDEEDGAEGFLEALDDVFWVYDDNVYTWYQRRFQGRSTRRGKGGKNKMRKGRGKGRGGRRFFRSRRKGKGKGRRKGRSHMVGEEGYEEDWQEEEEEEEWNEYDGYWAEGRIGTMPIGAQKNCTTRMSTVCSREKEKARKPRKERKEKGNQEMAKASQTMCSHPLHHQQVSNQPQQVHYSSSMSSNTGHGFVSFCETDPARVDVLQAQYDQEEILRRTRRGGQNVRDSRAEANKEKKKEYPVHVGEIGMNAGASKSEVRFPVLEGDVDTLRQGIRRRPLPPGRHEKPLQPGLQPEEEQEGTSLFTYGDSEQSEIPLNPKVGYSSQEEKPSQNESFEQSEESSEKDCVFSFHTNPVDACEKGLCISCGKFCTSNCMHS